MRSRPLLSALLLPVLLLAGCAGVAPEDYAGESPEFRLEEYFDGEVRAWGMFQSRSGEVRRRFTVDIDGRVEGDQIILDERFRYADGETDRRVWRIRRIDEHTYEGRADDVVGVAEGRRYGNALNWQYTLALDTGERTWNLHFNDWMYLTDERTLINTAEVTKFGFKVGEVTIFFRKADAGGDA
ncbi:DUF3833 domain-containing protein [Sediminicurvatus halobius]|uniref:DUF3833 domain-containing protein n=1 Tax=Sediminicurvatus halobius TaxID=2182432 RepID=A0A2U2N5U0_9GAMM|nr:DUF3833 domain-containing protein [Spiribacter halobius]PWG64581.1 DUF3833 domain-containing protein [Spiribacter halobius]UEX79099.1 DUF3833 domain-containing protein [Spiribacter halobius]